MKIDQGSGQVNDLSKVTEFVNGIARFKASTKAIQSQRFHY